MEAAEAELEYLLEQDIQERTSVCSQEKGHGQV